MHPPAHADLARRRGSNAPALGDRLRQLRVAAGLTQTELAGDRFSKEYVSQIERGKTRPTAETIVWLAERLGVDADFLARGVSAEDHSRLDTALARAEALSEAGEHDGAIAAYSELAPAVTAASSPEFAVRAAIGEAKALARSGRVRDALVSASRARELVEGAPFSDVERAEAVLAVGICRYLLSSISTAVALLTEALELADRSRMPCDQLRSEILHWRSRCYRRQRDYEAAKDDVERALELAEALRDERTVAHLYFQASLLADRDGHWVLARQYAERARNLYERVNDRAHVGKIENSLGALHYLLGRPDEAIKHLKEAFSAALDVGDDADAGRAVTSLAQVHFGTGEHELAETQARHALQLLADRDDFLDEIGAAQLVLGRALMEQGRLDDADGAMRAAEASFSQLSSASHRASAWLARGDLAARRGDDAAAAVLYRQAAEALQDLRF